MYGITFVYEVTTIMEGVKDMAKVFMIYYERDCEMYGKKVQLGPNEHMCNLIHNEIPSNVKIHKIEEL